MKLHRLVLRNYRGIAFRDIDFPDRGVVVVSGANEIGKSSMIEALDLLLEAKDRSTKKEVKGVKPTHADEGSEITAVISTGPYRFEYHKRFHKKPETRLTVLAPHREQLTGDEAHDRVQAILGETVDTDLWRAQRVLQSASTSPVDLSGCDALSRALDVSAGHAIALTAAPTGAEPLLIDRIDAEYRQYFTATGRPTGPWSTAVARLRGAREQVSLCEAAVAEVDDAVVRHGVLTTELARVTLDRSAGATRLEAARVAAEAVERLIDRLAHARALAGAAAKTHSASVAALGERRRLRSELDELGTRIAALVASEERTAQEEVVARQAAGAADGAAALARAAVEACQTGVDEARHAVDRIARRDEAARLSARLERVDAANARLTDVHAELATIALTDRVMRDVEAAAVTVELAAAAAERASARVELDAPDGSTGVRVLVAGKEVDLVPDAPWSQNVTTSTEVVVPGVVTVRVVPGAPAADSQATLDAAAEKLAAVLAVAGAADVDAARELQHRRRELVTSRDQLRATRDALLGDDVADALRARLAALVDVSSDGVGLDLTADTARAGLDAASAVLLRARTDHDAACAVATVASTAAMEARSRVIVVREKLATARERLIADANRLFQQRDSMSDDQLAIASEADGDHAREQAARVVALEAELDATAPEAVTAELADAARRAAVLRDHYDEVGGQLHEVTAQLKVYGSQGRKGRLDAAEAELEHAVADHARLQRRADAAELLRSVMTRHRDQSRQRYVEPFRAEVERLGRIVFGDDFEVEVDADLSFCSRTLSGRTVPYESLSGGAREQLGIVARLACAALVAKEDGVPVVIDDALGFSDAGRLAKMAEVFDAVAGDGQVIVLTCSPERYAGIRDAQHIELIA